MLCQPLVEKQGLLQGPEPMIGDEQYQRSLVSQLGHQFTHRFVEQAVDVGDDAGFAGLQRGVFRIHVFPEFVRHSICCPVDNRQEVPVPRSGQIFHRCRALASHFFDFAQQLLLAGVPQPAGLDIHVDDVPADLALQLLIQVRRVREAAPFRRGHQAPDQRPVHRFWRIGHWYVDGDDGPAAVTEDAPQGARPLGAGIGVLVLVTARHALHEAEDAMFPVLHASHESGPRLLGRWLDSRAENPVGSFPHQAPQRRQLAGFYHRPDHAKRRAIEADHQHAGLAGVWHVNAPER